MYTVGEFEPGRFVGISVSFMIVKTLIHSKRITFDEKQINDTDA